jgi:hypothetical protein
MLTIKAQMYRCTYDNQRLEDISDAVISGTVSCDPGRDVTWSLDAELTLEGWKRLKPYRDWVAPVMTVTYLDGTVRRGQLGLYLVLDSPEVHEEDTGTVRLEALDMLWLLASQGLGNPYVALANADKIKAVGDLLDRAVLTETGRGKNLYTLPRGINQRFRKKMEWPTYTPRLDVINDILQGSGCYPLWVTRNGRLTTRERGRARLKDRSPVRTYFANLPPGVRLRRGEGAPGGLSGEVVGAVETVPRAIDLTNEIVVINDDPEPATEGGRGAKGQHRITHPDNKRSKDAKAGRRKRKTRRYPVLDDDATAARVAKALAEELSTRNVTARLTVLPDPELDFIQETVALAIWNTSGRKIAVGQYKIHSVTYGFTPEDALMEIECGRIDNADDVLAGL